VNEAHQPVTVNVPSPANPPARTRAGSTGDEPVAKSPGFP